MNHLGDGENQTCRNSEELVALPLTQTGAIKSMPLSDSHFHSCDWGTSSFRLRLVRASDGGIAGEIKTSMGAKGLTASLGDAASAADRGHAFQDYLAGELAELWKQTKIAPLNAPVVVSGMASSSVGWMELPYARVPYPLDGSAAVVERLELTVTPSLELPVLLISGVATDRDMMRGEETQLMGLLALREFAEAASRSRVLLPGTHSKHAAISNGVLAEFHTYMSGELFEVLTRHSILRFTTQGGGDAFQRTAFEEGVRANQEVGLARSLFQTRIRGVLHGHAPQGNRDFLSGLLIGSELADVAKELFSGTIIVAAPEAMAGRYLAAAEILGISNRLLTTTDSQLDHAVALGHRQILSHYQLPPFHEQ